MTSVISISARTHLHNILFRFRPFLLRLMGYDVHRFEGDVDEELICSICGGVYESPVQAPQCEHIFCVSCINEWLKRGHASCPVDRSHVDGRDLVQPPRIVRNLLARLKIACDNASFGCQAIVKLDALDAHLTTCKHNPKRPVDCEKGCGSKVPLDEVSDRERERERRGREGECAKAMKSLSSKRPRRCPSGR